MQPNESPLYKMDDGKSVVQFYFRTERNNAASNKQGRPVYDKVLMARIISPGNEMGPARSSPEFEVERTFADGTVRARQWMVVDGKGPVTQRERFTRQLDAWEKNLHDESLTGIPLDKWPGIDVVQIAALREANIHTVEQLANLPDQRLLVVGPNGRQLRDQAKAYLDTIAGQAPLQALAAENAQLKDQIALLTGQLQDLSAKLDQLAKAPPEPAAASEEKPRRGGRAA